MLRKSVSVTNLKTHQGYDGRSLHWLSQWPGSPFGLVEVKGSQRDLMIASSPWRYVPALVPLPLGLAHVGRIGKEKSQAKLRALL